MSGGCFVATVAILTKQAELAGEVAHVFEALVHTGEPDRGHIVEQPESLQDRSPDSLTRDLGRARADVVLHVGRQTLDCLGVDRSVLAGRSDPGDHLAPLEGLPLARSLEHHHDSSARPFVGRETPGARHALPAATYRQPLLHLSRVDDTIVGRAAPRATHTLTVAAAVAVRRYGTVMREPGTSLSVCTWASS